MADFVHAQLLWNTMPPMNSFEDVLDHVGADAFQDALLASHAVYADSPQHFLEGNGHRFSHMSVSRLPRADGRLLIALSHTDVHEVEDAKPAATDKHDCKPAAAKKKGAKRGTTKGDDNKPSTARKRAIVAFRGTSNIDDLKAGVNFFPVLSEGFHTGFFMRSKVTPIATLLALARDGYQLVFTGHSLGGGVAQIAAWHVLCKLALPCAKKARQPVCVTFAAPLVATGQTAHIINEKYKYRFFNVADPDDIVPKIVSLAQELGQRSLGNPQAIKSMIQDKKQGAKSLAGHVQGVLEACGAQCMLGQGLQDIALPVVRGFLQWTLKTFTPAILSLVAYRPIGVLCTTGSTINVHSNGGELHARLRLSAVSDVTLDNITAHSLARYSIWLKDHLPRESVAAPRLPKEVPLLKPNVTKVELRLLPELDRLHMLLLGENLAAVNKVGVDGVRICEGQEAFVVKHNNQTNVQILLECPLPKGMLPMSARRFWRVWLTTTFEHDEFSQSDVPLTVVHSHQPSCAADAGLDEVLRQAAAVSLFSRSSSQGLHQFPELPRLLGELLDILPLELAFLPLAKGEPLDTAINKRMFEVEPPCAMLISEVGLDVLKRVIEFLEKEDPKKRTPLNEELATQASNFADFMGQATDNYFFQAAIKPQPASAVAGFAMKADSCNPQAATGDIRRRHGGAVRAPHHEITRLIVRLKANVEKLESAWERIGSPQFCGQTLNVLVEACGYASDCAWHAKCELRTLEPLFSFARDLVAEKHAIAEKEHAARQVSKHAGPKEANVPEAQRVLRNQVATSFVGVLEKVGLAEHFYSPRDTLAGLDVGLTYVPYSANGLNTVKRVAQAVGASAGKVFGVFGALGRAALGRKKTPLVEFAKGVDDIWTREFPCDVVCLGSYRDFVSFIFGVLLPEVHPHGTALVREERIAGMLSNREFSVSIKTPLSAILDNWKECFPNGCVLQRVPPRFRFCLAVRIKAILIVHQLRMHLSSLPLVGVFGPSNSGKTTVCRGIMGHWSKLMPKPGMAFKHRTLAPSIYLLPNKNAALLDTAGADDDELRLKGLHSNAALDMTMQLLNMCSCRVIVVKSSLRSRVAANILGVTRDRQDQARRPTLTCVTFADELFERQYDSDNCDEDVSEERARYSPSSYHEEPENILDEEEKGRDGTTRAICSRTIEDDPITPRYWACFDTPTLAWKLGGNVPETLSRRILTRDDVVAWVQGRIQEL